MTTIEEYQIRNNELVKQNTELLYSNHALTMRLIDLERTVQKQSDVIIYLEKRVSELETLNKLQDDKIKLLELKIESIFAMIKRESN